MITVGRQNCTDMMYSPALKQDILRALPFALLFFSSLFLPAASHRMLFYLCAPVFIYLIFSTKDAGVFFRTYSFKFFAVYMLYFSVSCLWAAPESGEAVKYWRNASCVIVYVTALVVTLPSMIRLPKNYALIIAGVIFLYTLGLMGLFLHNAQNFRFSIYRLEGIGRYQNTIHLSFLLSLMVLWLVSLGKLDTRKHSYIRAGLIFFFLFSIALTKARSAYVALAGCIAMLGALGRMRTALFITGLGMAGGLLCVVIWGFSLSDVITRSDNYRLDIWTEAYTGIYERPLFGHGVNADPSFHRIYIQPEGWESTHNMFLGHAYTGGFVGLVVFILLLGNMIAQAMKAFFHEWKTGVSSTIVQFTGMSVAFACFAGAFNFSHFLVGSHIQWLVFWMPFALTWYLEASKNIKT
jgi:O-antigen ligase